MSLPHKDYVLPEVDLSHDEGDPRWHEAGGKMTSPIYDEDGTIKGHLWNGLEPGHYREYWRLCVEETWAQLVTDFEQDPDDIHAAYWYVDGHPVFWVFERRVHDEYPANHVSRLKFEGALVHRSWPEIAPHRDDQKLAWWYEFGKRNLYPDEHGCHTTWLDHELIGHAETYEAAVIAVARKIHEHYGNDRQIVDSSDRQIVDSEEWRKGGGDGGGT